MFGAEAAIIAGTLYGYASAQNAYKPPPPFPRSEWSKDFIMLRRYEARRQIKQAHRIRVALWTIFTPIVICVLIKLWSLSIEWVLQ